MYISDNTPVPCFACAQSIIAAGIKEVVVPLLERYEPDGFSGLVLLRECGIKVRGILPRIKYASIKMLVLLKRKSHRKKGVDLLNPRM